MISPRRRFNDEAHHRSHQITKGADIVVKSCSRQLSGTHHLTLPQKPRQGRLLTHVVPRMFQTRTRLRKHAQFVPKTYPRFVHLPNSIWDVSQPNDLDRIRIDPVDGCRRRLFSCGTSTDSSDEKLDFKGVCMCMLVLVTTLLLVTWHCFASLLSIMPPCSRSWFYLSRPWPQIPSTLINSSSSSRAQASAPQQSSKGRQLRRS